MLIDLVHSSFIFSFAKSSKLELQTAKRFHYSKRTFGKDFFLGELLDFPHDY